MSSRHLHAGQAAERQRIRQRHREHRRAGKAAQHLHRIAAVQPHCLAPTDHRRMMQNLLGPRLARLARKCAGVMVGFLARSCRHCGFGPRDRHLRLSRARLHGLSGRRASRRRFAQCPGDLRRRIVLRADRLSAGGARRTLVAGVVEGRRRLCRFRPVAGEHRARRRAARGRGSISTVRSPAAACVSTARGSTGRSCGRRPPTCRSGAATSRREPCAFRKATCARTPTA